MSLRTKAACPGPSRGRWTRASRPPVTVSHPVCKKRAAIRLPLQPRHRGGASPAPGPVSGAEPTVAGRDVTMRSLPPGGGGGGISRVSVPSPGTPPLTSLWAVPSGPASLFHALPSRELLDQRSFLRDERAQRLPEDAFREHGIAQQHAAKRPGRLLQHDGSFACALITKVSFQDERRQLSLRDRRDDADSVLLRHRSSEQSVPAATSVRCTTNT